MNTKLLMTTSAFVLGAAGILLTFMPEEVANFLHLTDGTTIQFQILGALYFGFAMLNWTAKANIIGGIYGKPVCLGNFTHFAIGGLSLIKLVVHNFGNGILICAILYFLFAILFGYVLFTTPSSIKK